MGIVWSLLFALIFVWVLLIVALYFLRPDGATLRESARLLPDVLRLLHRLARDKSLNRGLRIRLWLLLAYLALPIDLIPDFLPVVGYADDAILILFTLRSVARIAGPGAVAQHWPGTPDGLATLTRLTSPIRR